MTGILTRLNATIREIRDDLAPDPRISVFEVRAEMDGDEVALRGACSVPAAIEELHRRIDPLDRIPLLDEVVRLPDVPPGAPIHALVTAATAPMLAGPLITATHVSQALLGERLLILRSAGRWLQCRSEDGYLGWVHRGYLQPAEEATARVWEIGTSGLAALSLGAALIDETGEVLARLPWGARVVSEGDGRARLPDGRSGWLRGEVVPVVEQPVRFPASGEAVVATAALWVGAPYLWGGKTPAGVDCSGFVQALYRTHGISIPRDSDQQARAGEDVDPGPDFSALLPGDLLFFAEDEGRITHVTLSAGGGRILHSSLGNGGVARNDLNGELEYERELRDIFVCARRFLTAGS